MPNDNIRSHDHAFSTDMSITNSETKGKSEIPKIPEKSERSKSDDRLLIIAVIIIAIADVILGLATRQYMLLVAVNTPLVAIIPLLRQK